MKFHFSASKRPEAQTALRSLIRLYGQNRPAKADVIVALGGDGWMLETLRKQLDGVCIPVYGMHRGSVGFLMNAFEEHELCERVDNATRTAVYPLKMDAERIDGNTVSCHAINEMSLWRHTPQIAKIRILVDGDEQMVSLLADGILLATPAGSTAYNLSVQGPVLPLTANLLALTPIAPYRPRRWRGALLRRSARVRLEIIEPERRSVMAAADSVAIGRVLNAEICEDRSRPLHLLFDEGFALDDRIRTEQFTE